jgi:DNA recombination protein RmuC
VLEVGLKIGSDAQNLTEALKGDSQKRGSWGETQLEKTLQISGLIEHDHYEKQTSMQDAEGRRKQTDFLIKLPDDKHIIIDSKVSLAAYDRAVAAETDEQLERALNEHVKSVKRHIDDLASKDYTNLIGIRSPSFVLMFMPIEPAYIEALKYERDLFSYGYERNIVLVSHTTLIPILRTVSNLWSMDRSTREARELGNKAGDIYNQVRKVAERLSKIGGSLQAASNHYNDTVKALSGRQGLRGKVERFADLSSKVTQAIPEIEPLHSDIQSESLELLAEPLIEEEAPEDELPVT